MWFLIFLLFGLFILWIHGVIAMVQGVWWGFEIFGGVPLFLCAVYSLFLIFVEPKKPLTRLQRRAISFIVTTCVIFIVIGIGRVCFLLKRENEIASCIQREDSSKLIQLADSAYWHSDGQLAIDAISHISAAHKNEDKCFCQGMKYLYEQMTAPNSRYADASKEAVLRIARAQIIEVFELRVRHATEYLKEIDYESGKQSAPIPDGEVAIMDKGMLPDEMFIGKTLERVQEILESLRVVVVIIEKRVFVGEYRWVGEGGHAGNGYKIRWNVCAYDPKNKTILATTNFYGGMPSNWIKTHTKQGDWEIHGGPPERSVVTTWISGLQHEYTVQK